MMPFTHLTAVAAPLPLANVDTDQILPARFLKTITREGLGAALFATMRESQDFILDRPPWDRAEILVAGANFGSGSSREHAPWALRDFGIRSIIAPSFADIFRNNCYANGILPIALDEELVAALLAMASSRETCTMTIDLAAQTINAGRASYRFKIEPRRRDDLLVGVDEIGRSLTSLGLIESFERLQSRKTPWVRPIASSMLANLTCPSSSLTKA